jgi:hypothetical protein
MKTKHYSEKFRKFLLTTLTITSFFVFSGNRALATHVAGGDIQFCWVGPGPNTYRFTYTLYRNCGSIINPNPTQAPGSVTLDLISATCGQNLSTTMFQDAQPNGSEVSLACGSVLTYCNGGTVQGYQKWTYTLIYTLPTQCSDWVFSVDLSARNQNITTLNNPGNQSLTMRATLNNVLAPNDCSPGFSNPPLAFLCVNQGMTYNHAAIDANGDSLVYTRVDPLQTVGNTIVPVDYQLPFSTANPLSNSNLTLNSQTGEVNITPTGNGELAVIAFRVDEYRNGQLIGSVMRDMQVLVMTCTNDLPTASGLNSTSNYIATVCTGVQSCFTITTNDLNPNDTVTMTWNSGIPAATFVVTGTPHPSGTFCWTPTVANVGLNVFTVHVQDNACPIRGSQAFTYTINVSAPPTVNFAGDPNICQGDTATITAVGASLYAWSPNQFINTNSGATVKFFPPSTQTYTVVATSADNCTRTSSITINVSPEPILFTPTNPSVCHGSSLPVNVSGAFYYSWSPTTGIISSTPDSSSVVIGPNQTTVYTVVGHSEEGCTGTGSFTFTVNPNPVPVVGSNSPICAGTQLNLTATGGTGYSWTGPNNFSSSTQNPSIASATAGASGNYSVVVTNANNCSASGSVSVAVNANPTPVVGSNSPVCAGSQLNLTASGGSGYSWTGPNSFSSSTQNPSISNSTTAASGNYSVIVTNASNCSSTGSVSVTVNANPTPVVGSNSPICAGAQLTLTATGGTGYSWTGPNSFSSSTQNPSISNATAAASGSYSVIVTNANNCSSTGSVSVTVNANPVPVVGSNSPICAGAQLTLTASGGSGYSWTGPNSFSSANQNPSISNATTAASGNYSVIVTSANNCSSTGSVSVTVNSNPVPVVGSNSPICAGAQLTLTASGGSSYSWTGPNSFSSANQNPSISNATTAASGNYSVVVTDANSCASTGSVNVTVNANPVPVVGSNSPICAGAQLTLSASGGSNYSWTGPNSFSSGSQNPSISNATTAASGNYSVVVTDANSCVSTGSVSVTVNSNPVPVVGSNSPICAGAQLSLTANGGSNYSWTGPNSFSSANQNPSIAGATTAASGNYTVVVTDASSCVSTGSVSVIVNANPVPVITPSGPLSFCIGGSVTLDAGTWASYSWSGQGETTQSITVSVNRTVGVTVTDGNACVGTSAPVTVTVNPLPVAVVTPAGPVLICSNSPATLSANTGLNFTYRWFNGTTEIVGATSSQYLATTAGMYSVEVIDGNGCSAHSNSVQVNLGVGPVVTITPPPSLGCQQNTIFVGYGPQSLTLTANAPGAATFLWSPGGQTTQSIQVTQAGEYSVVAFDALGCPSPSPAVLSPGIQMIDIRCGNNLQKVTLCHVPEGNFNNPQTICIGEPAVEPHLRLHQWDCLGPCSLYYSGRGTDVVEDFYAIPYPNPFNTAFNLQIITASNEVVYVKVIDVTGRIVESYSGVDEQTQIGEKLGAGVYTALVSQGENRRMVQIIKTAR